MFSSCFPHDSRPEFSSGSSPVLLGFQGAPREFCLGSPQVFLMVLDRFSSGSPKVLLRFSLGSSQVLLRYSPPSTPQVLLRFSTGSPRFSSGSPQVLFRFSSGSKVLLMYSPQVLLCVILSCAPSCSPQGNLMNSLKRFSSGSPRRFFTGSLLLLMVSSGVKILLRFSSGSKVLFMFSSGSPWVLLMFSSGSPQVLLRFTQRGLCMHDNKVEN